MFTQHSMNMMIEEAWTMPSLKQLRRRSWAASSSGFMHELSAAREEAEEAQVSHQNLRHEDERSSLLCHPSHSNEPKLQSSGLLQPFSLSDSEEPAFLVTPMAPVVRSAPETTTLHHFYRTPPSERMTNQSNSNARPMEVTATTTTASNSGKNKNYRSNKLGDLAHQLQSVIDGPLSTLSAPTRIARIQERQRRLSLSSIPNTNPLSRDDDWLNDESMGSFAYSPARSPAVHQQSMFNSMNFLVVVKNHHNHSGISYTTDNNNMMNSINSLSVSDLPWIQQHATTTTPSPPGRTKVNKVLSSSPTACLLHNTISTAMLTPQSNDSSLHSRDDTVPSFFADATAPSFFADLCNAVTATPLTGLGCVDVVVEEKEDEEAVEKEDCQAIVPCRSDSSTVGSAVCTVTLKSWPSVSSISSASHRSQLLLKPAAKNTGGTVMDLATGDGVAAVTTATIAGSSPDCIPNEIEIITMKPYESPKPKYYTIRHSTEIPPMLGLLPTSSSSSSSSSMSALRKRLQTTHKHAISAILPPPTRIRRIRRIRRRRDPDDSSLFCPSLVADETRRRVQQQREYKCQLFEIHQLLDEWDDRNRALLQEQQCAMSTIQRLGQN